MKASQIDSVGKKHCHLPFWRPLRQLQRLLSHLPLGSQLSEDQLIVKTSLPWFALFWRKKMWQTWFGCHPTQKVAALSSEQRQAGTEPEQIACQYLVHFKRRHHLLWIQKLGCHPHWSHPCWTAHIATGSSIWTDSSENNRLLLGWCWALICCLTIYRLFASSCSSCCRCWPPVGHPWLFRFYSQRSKWPICQLLLVAD